MKRRRPIMTARSLAIVIAVVAIIAPSLVLSYFAFQSTHDIHSRMDQLMADGRHSEAGDIDRSLQETVRAVEDAILDDIVAIPPEQLPEGLSALKANRAIIRELFLLDRNFQPIFPRPLASALSNTLTAAEEAGPRLEPAMLLLRKAASVEFAQNSPADAIPIYREFVSQARWPRDQAEAALAVAGCLYKLGQFREATEQYDRALKDYHLLVLEPTMSLLAAYQAALSLEKAGDAAAAAERYVAIYEDMVDGRTADPDEHRVAFFKNRIDEALQRLVKDSVMSSDLKERSARVRSRDRFLADLRTWLIVKIKADVPNAVGKRHFVHLFGDSPGPEPHVVAYTLLTRRGEKDWNTLVGFAFNLDALLKQVIDAKLAEISMRRSGLYVIALEDLDQQRLLGEELPERTVTRLRLADPFPFWQIAVTERSSEYAEYYGKQLTWFYASMNLVLIGVILAGVAVVIRDISRQERLAQLQRDFVSSVSHELKTPLALIRMFGEMLSLGRVRSPEKQQEYYQIITRESERLTHLINNVLDFSRIDAGAKQYTFHMADLTEVVRSTTEAYALTLRRQGFEVVLHLDRLPEMWIDSDAISQSLLNLLNNAAKYSRERKSIIVALRREGGHAELSVTDQGIGIDEAEIPRIFEKFHRADDPLVRETQGTGLGLSIIRHVTEAHGGQVTAKSKKGEGSTFTLILPIRTEPEEAAGAKSTR